MGQQELFVAIDEPHEASDALLGTLKRLDDDTPLVVGETTWARQTRGQRATGRGLRERYNVARESPTAGHATAIETPDGRQSTAMVAS